MNPTNPKPLQLRTALPPKKNPKTRAEVPAGPGQLQTSLLLGLAQKPCLGYGGGGVRPSKFLEILVVEGFFSGRFVPPT